MQLISQQLAQYMESGSWIRKMFEAGIAMKKEFGADAVCDFSLGNPDLPPPAALKTAMEEISQDAAEPFFLGYMPNAGYPEARAALAQQISKEQGVSISGEDLVLTCGAAGALNAFLRAVLEPGEEVLTPAPYFVEYGFYCQNHNGVLKSVPSKPLSFELDLEAIDAAITPKTRIVLLNSPNNPSGAVYSRQELVQLSTILEKHNKNREKPLFLLSDEPYRFLTFDGVEVPSLLELYPYSVVCSSFSKNLSMAGERIGYACINPTMPGKEQLLGALIMTNRILGFVNAPALAQKLMMRCLGSQVDTTIYESRRKAMADVLDNGGYAYSMPKGTFYFFPEAPGGDDVAFCNCLQEEKILAVPGRGFGYPGYFRLTFCIDEAVIHRSKDGFKRAFEKAIR